MASRLQDVLLRGLASARPAATLVANGTLYYSTDTQITEQSNGTLWVSYSDAGSGGGGGGPHAVTHQTGGGDVVDVKLLGGFPGGTANFLRADGTFQPPPTGGIPAAHATTHQPGGADPMAVDAASVTGSLRTLGTGANQAAPGNDTRFSDARNPLPHATTHSQAGSDPVDVKNLTGYPGGTTTFLRADKTFAAPPSSPTRYGVIGMVIDGAAAVITTGVKGFIEIPFPCTILSWVLLSSDPAVLAGSITIDIWKDTLAAYPPTIADTITAAAKPSLSAVNKNSGAPTGWNTTINAGDILGFNVDLASTVTKVTLTLKVQMV